MAKQKPANGRNRAERRANAKHPQRQSGGRSTALRIGIIVALTVMILGFFLMQLLR